MTEDAAVDTTSIADTLPELYRSVLERVVSLEHTGHRHEALVIRRAAVEAYSKAWDARAQDRLMKLQSRAERVLDGLEQPHPAPAADSTSRRTRVA